MSENGKLYDRLRKMNVPAAGNPEHQAALRKQLERIAAEEAVPSGRRGLFIRRPILVLSGALAGAAALILGVFLIVRTPGSSGPEIARANGDSLIETTVLSFQTGNLSVIRNGVRKKIVAGDRLEPADTVLTADGAAGLLQIGDAVLAKLESGTTLSLPQRTADDPARPLTVRLTAGRVTFVVRGPGGRGLAVATDVATFVTRGTVFTVMVDEGRRSVLSVGEGDLTVRGAAPADRVLLEHAAAGQMVTVDRESRVSVAKRIDGEMMRGFEALKRHLFVTDHNGEKPVMLTLIAEPGDAVITLDWGLQATGRLSLLVSRGRTFACSIERPGYVTRTEELEADQGKTVTFALVKEEAPVLLDDGGRATPPPTPAPTQPAVRGRWADRSAVPVPTRGSALTGKAADWQGIAPIIGDATGDAKISGPGTDIEAVYLARTDDVLSVGIRFAGGVPSGDWKPECVLTLTAENDEQLTVTAAPAADGAPGWRAVAQGGLSAGAAVECAAAAEGAILTLNIPVPAPLRAPGAKCEAVLTLTVQKYGKLRVVADTTDTVLIGM